MDLHKFSPCKYEGLNGPVGRFDDWRYFTFPILTVDAVIGGNLVQELGPVYMEVGDPR